MPGIIVGVDGSDHSQRALRRALQEGAVHQAPVTVLTVHPAMRGYAGGAVSYPQDAADVERAREKAQADTDKALAALGDGRPPSVTVKAVNGPPVEELLKASEDADMIVLGKRGTGGFARLRLGSVTSQIAHHAHCPVLIVPMENP